MIRGIDKGNVISMILVKDECDWRFDDLKQYIHHYITKPFDTQELVNTVKRYFILRHNKIFYMALFFPKIHSL